MAIRGLDLGNDIRAGFQTSQRTNAVGAGFNRRDVVAASCGNLKESTGQGQGSLSILFQDNELGILIVLVGDGDGLMLVHNLNQPGLAVDNVAIRDGSLGDLVPAGLAVRQINEAVCVGDVGTGVICGAIGAVGGAKEANLEGNPGQVLAGRRVQLPNQEALLGGVEELNVDNPVTVRCDGHILPVGVREAISGRRNGLGDAVGAVGQVLKRQLAVAIRLALPVNGAALGVLQVKGVQRKGSIRQGPGIGQVAFGDTQVAEMGVLELEFGIGLAPFQGLSLGVVASRILLIFVVERRHFLFLHRNGPVVVIMLVKEAGVSVVVNGNNAIVIGHLGTDVLAVNPDLERGVGQRFPSLTVPFQNTNIGIAGIGEGESLELLTLVNLSLLPVLIIDEVAVRGGNFPNGNRPRLSILGIQELAILGVCEANLAIGVRLEGVNGLRVNPNLERSAGQTLAGLPGDFLNLDVGVLIVGYSQHILLNRVTLVKQPKVMNGVGGEQVTSRCVCFGKGVQAGQNAGAVFTLQNNGAIGPRGHRTQVLTIALNLEDSALKTFAAGVLLNQLDGTELLVNKDKVTGAVAVFVQVNVPGFVNGTVAGGGLNLPDGVVAGRNVVGEVGADPLNRNLTIRLAFPLLVDPLAASTAFLVTAVGLAFNQEHGTLDAVAILVNFAEGTVTRVRFIGDVDNGLAGDENSLGFGVVGTGHRCCIGSIIEFAFGRRGELLDDDVHGSFASIKSLVPVGKSIRTSSNSVHGFTTCVGTLIIDAKYGAS